MQGIRTNSHNTLITSPNLLQRTMVKTRGNLGTLLLNRHEHIASLVVESLVGRVVADLLDGVPDDLLEVDGGFGGNFAKDLYGGQQCDTHQQRLTWLCKDRARGGFGRLTMIIPVLQAVSQATCSFRKPMSLGRDRIGRTDL